MKKIIFRSENPNKDWQKDFELENGNYMNNCIECNCEFMGHKRRVVCHECTYPIRDGQPVIDFTNIFTYVNSLQAFSGMDNEEAGTMYHILNMWQQKRYFEPETYKLTEIEHDNK